MENYSSHLLAAFLILLTLSTTMDSASAARRAAGETNTEFIRTSCSATTYPKLCYTSLLTHATAVRQDPKLLAHTALSVTLDTARSTSTMMGKLSHIRGMTPREVGAMRDCVEELSDSVDQLRRSTTEMNEIKGSNFGMIMGDVQTWVSAALTDEDTCMEGFAGKVMNGNVKTAVRERVVNVAHLTSNALALINSYAALHN
ncbi:21 kDa protein-like [Olea europaea var. sylvestris]|uniref:21 kDa -like n=1 Tax=Olea europaea subsp. europaea TaxID=158383 RepID=A0A8S0TIC1_OLEEU|nr:21 kDa protein-like [Olea europaea var. sylvestris]CAA3003347.1 21 kDa -like [Olea europaea subsp. europaea]